MTASFRFGSIGWRNYSVYFQFASRHFAYASCRATLATRWGSASTSTARSRHALSLVGERWSLLVVRELLKGPRRYTDLAAGLPGIGTNILASRLRELEAGGVVQRRKLPPPAASTVYELTEYGARARGGRPRARALGCADARRCPGATTTSSPTGACRRSPRCSIPSARAGSPRRTCSASTTTSSPSASRPAVCARSAARPTTPTSTSRPTWRRSSRSRPATSRRTRRSRTAASRSRAIRTCSPAACGSSASRRAS